MNTKKNTKETAAAALPAITPILLTDEEKAAKKIEAVRLYLNAKLETAQRTIDEFHTQVEINPSHALEWSMGAFTAAATMEIALHAQKMLNAGCTLIDVKNELLRYALQNVTRSTSQPSNLISLERKEAASLMFQDLGRWA